MLYMVEDGGGYYDFKVMIITMLIITRIIKVIIIIIIKQIDFIMNVIYKRVYLRSVVVYGIFEVGSGL